MIIKIEGLDGPFELEDFPGALDQRIDLFTGIQQLSSFSFAVAATEKNAALLLAGGGFRASAVVGNGWAPATVSAVVFSESAIAPGIYYIGDETIEILSVSSAGDSLWSVSLARGLFGSTADGYSPGTRIYKAPPFVKHRRVTFGAWRGLIENVRTDAQQTQILIECVEAFSTMVASQGNATPSAYRFDRGDLRITQNSETGEKTLSGWLRDTVRTDWARPGSSIQHYRVGGALVQGFYTAGRVVFNGVRALIGSELGEVGDVPPDEAVHEVLFVQGEDPVSLALSLLLSTGRGINTVHDVFGKKWGLGLASDFLDLPSWEEKIGQGAPVDHFLLGWDGPYNFFDVVYKRLLEPNGLFFAQSNEGRQKLHTDDIFDVGQVFRTISAGYVGEMLSNQIEMDRRLGEQQTQITARIGETPFTDPIERTDVVEFGNRTDATNNRTSPFVFDFSSYDKTEKTMDRIDVFLQENALKRRRSYPVLRATFRAEDVPDLGEWFLIRGGPECGLIGPDGSRVFPEDTEILFFGRIIGKTTEIKNRTVGVELALYNWFSRDRPALLIAPAAEVSKSGFRWVFSLDFPSVDGGSGFVVGDQVTFWDASGRPLPGVGVSEIVAVSGGLFILDPAPPDAVIGSRVRLANLPIYNNDNWPGSAYFGPFSGRRFSFFGVGDVFG